MLKIEWLKTLHEVERYGSFSAVGVHRRCSAMAISKQISALEREVGEPLLSRSTKKMTLTEAGELLLDRSRTVVSEHEAIESWLDERHGEPSGQIRVTVLEEDIATITLTPWMGEFLRQFPKIEPIIELVSDFHELPKVKADIYWGLGVHLGLIMPGLKRKRLLESKFGIYASPEYLATHGEPLTPADLSGHFVIGYTNNEPNNSLVIKGGEGFNENGLQGVYLPTKIVSGVNNLELAEQGFGLINTSATLFAQMQKKRPYNLVPVLEDYWHEGIEAYAYYHLTKIEQPKVRAFLDFFYHKRTEWAQ